jgi:membrane protein YdbS with pleckstrin-like domain
MQWIIDILGLVCLVLAGSWMWFRKKNKRISALSIYAFFILVIVTMVAAFFIKH